MEQLLKDYSSIRELSERCYDEETSRNRHGFERDYSRILYSSSFRRLQGKMQLLGIANDSFTRNRLTHSLEVAQVTTSIVDHINNELLAGSDNNKIYDNHDIHVLYSAALAHDLGNPPFGHKGEEILNKLALDHSNNTCGFEGNAQTIRILTHLEKKSPYFRGLNLTKRTLLSVVKYNISFTEALKSEKKPHSISKFNYDFDLDLLRSFSSDNEDLKIRTLDAQILDLADEIAYAAHDLEDALSLNIFTIDDLLYEFKLMFDKQDNKTPAITDEQNHVYETLNGLVTQARSYASNAKFYESSEEYSYLFKKELTSSIVHALIKDITYKPVSSKLKEKTKTMNDFELSYSHLETLSSGLKKLTFSCLLRKNDIKLYEKKGEIVLETLFDFYLNNPNMLPPEYQCSGSDLLIRTVVDYISGMMDSYALNKYSEITGKKNISLI